MEITVLYTVSGEQPAVVGRFADPSEAIEAARSLEDQLDQAGFDCYNLSVEGPSGSYWHTSHASGDGSSAVMMATA